MYSIIYGCTRKDIYMYLYKLGMSPLPFNSEPHSLTGRRGGRGRGRRGGRGRGRGRGAPLPTFLPLPLLEGVET